MKNIFSEGLIIGYLTVMGYALAFIYEYSYLNYFGVPYYFIDIKLGNIFLAIFIIFIFLIITKTILNLIEKSGFISDSGIGRLRAANIFSFIIMTPGIFALLNNKVLAALLLIGGYILISSIEIFGILIYGRNVNTWKDKKGIFEYLLSNKVKKSSFVDDFFSKLFFLEEDLTRNYLRIFLNSVVFCYVSLSMGGFIASNRIEFYRLSTSPNRIIVAQYNDSLLTLSIDKKTRKLSNDLRIIKKDELFSNKIDLILEKIGPLEKFNIIK